MARRMHRPFGTARNDVHQFGFRSIAVAAVTCRPLIPGERADVTPGRISEQGMPDSKSSAWRGASSAQRDTGSTHSDAHPQDSRIRVVLVGNQTMVRAGLAHVLATHARLTVVSEGLVSEAVHEVEVHQPDVLVLVGDNDPGGGVDVVPAVQAASARTMVL